MKGHSDPAIAVSLVACPPRVTVWDKVGAIVGLLPPFLRCFFAMTYRFFAQLTACALSPLLIWGCGGGTPEAADPAAPEPDTAEPATGQLEIRANGEDFVRQGFTSKDGWEISFDHVYVTLAEVTAYQSDPAFDAEAGGMPVAETKVSLAEPMTVDLAAGDADADPILVDTVEAPAGQYNALSWKMVAAPDGPSAGYPLMLQGTATKAGETVDFVIQFTPTLGFVCGDFVGDERKGILSATETAELEATFHFDHLFGDGEAPADDDINTGALGFDPLAALAEGGSLTVDTAALESQLSAEEYAMLLEILPSLGHVGEGHCDETELG
jgi:hypothetical protein